MDSLEEIAVLLPFAAVAAGILAAKFDAARRRPGVECDMGGCNRHGEPTFRCAECGRVKTYFCRPCERLLIGNLRDVGRQAVYCPDCAERVVREA